MKAKIFLFYMILCFTWQVKAQTGNNNTIVNDNSTWAVLIYGLGAYNIPCCVKTQYVYFDGDSIIGINSYKKVFSCDDSLHKNIKYEGLIREEEKKTYFIPANSDTEYLLYDFSLEEGMNFEYGYFWTRDPSVTLYVNSVDSIEINGSMRKRIELSLYGRVIDVWVEEIGSLSGVLYPCYSAFLSGGVKELLCYYQDNEFIYKIVTYDGCYYDKVEDIISVQTIVIDNNNINVYPNPVDDILTVFSSNNTILLIEIFDVSGKKNYSQTYKDVINMSSFSTGLYVLKVYDINGKVSSFKIIKE